MEDPLDNSKRLMTLRSNGQFGNVISAYAPTLDASNETREAFYAELDKILAKLKSTERVVVLNDFTARVGRDVEL